MNTARSPFARMPLGFRRTRRRRHRRARRCVAANRESHDVSSQIGKGRTRRSVTTSGTSQGEPAEVSGSPAGFRWRAASGLPWEPATAAAWGEPLERAGGVGATRPEESGGCGWVSSRPAALVRRPSAHGIDWGELPRTPLQALKRCRQAPRTHRVAPGARREPLSSRSQGAPVFKDNGCL